MLIQFNFVQQCIQISTRINSSMYIGTYVFVSFETTSSIRIFILIDPIFNIRDTITRNIETVGSPRNQTQTCVRIWHLKSIFITTNTEMDWTEMKSG